MRSFTELTRQWRTWVGAATLALAACVPLQPGAPAPAPRDRTLLARELAAIALHEHALMGGAVIDAGGGLIRGGLAEAERDPVGGSGEPAWRRVQGYWQVLPGDWPQRMSAGSLAEQRVRVVDQPWSAAFISFVMWRAGLGSAEFRASASHHDYVRAAFASSASEAQGEPTDYAYRACDIVRTAPRVGDLLCATRGGDARFDTFEQVRTALAEGPLRMHCELVVHRDSAGVEAVGGNVLNTVTLRRLGLEADGSGRLWQAYLRATQRERAAQPPDPPAEGQAQALLPDTYLNRRPWSVLLQLRGRDLSAPDGAAETLCG